MAVGASGADRSRVAVSGRLFFAIATAVFAACVAATVAGSLSMSAMGGMPMPGGWTLSMAWMRLRGQTWPGAAVSFIGMWMPMMAAMMLPSLTPALWRCHQAVGRAPRAHPGWTTMVMVMAYFFAWAAAGAAVFPLGAALAWFEMHFPVLARAVPLATGGLVVIAGLLQFTAWKAYGLACCREALRCQSGIPMDARTAWRRGMHLGIHCVGCCGSLTVFLLIVGVMDLRVMAAVTAAITLERLAPAALSVAPAIGAILIGTGLLWIVQAIALA